MNHKENIWTLSASCLAGEMNESEKNSFLKNLEKDPYRKEEFNKMKKIWDKLENNPKRNYSHTQPHWERLKAKIENDGLLEQQTTKYIHLSSRFFKIAASILLIAALGISSYYLIKGTGGDEPFYSRYVAESGTSTYVLPDGSRVILNKTSELTLDKDFNSDRNVTLKGEAWFEVMADPSLPFTIQTSNANVTVLGTQFNVKENKEKTEVLVESGIVKINPKKLDNELFLEKGEFAISTKSEVLKSDLKDMNYLSWKTKKFRFDNYDLYKVFEILEESYHTEINYKTSEINHLKLSSKYDQQTLDAILNTICLAFDLNYSVKDNIYFVTSNK